MVKYSVYRLDPGELTGRGPRSQKSRPTIFVAYRFRSKASVNFRIELEKRISELDALRDVRVVDGHVLPGEHWPSKIRKRLKKSRLVVADVSGLSREVLFECGFAWGWNRRILPVVEEHSHHEGLPGWLTSLQVGQYGDAHGWGEILDSISENLTSRRRSKVPPPDPIPHRVVWLVEEGDLSRARKQLEESCRRFALTVSQEDLVVDDIYEAGESLVYEVCRSALVVASLDGSATDCLNHFCAGVVVAKPTAGAATRKLYRRVLFVVRGGMRVEDVLAESARKATQNIRLISGSELGREIMNFGKRFEAWRREQEA